MPVTPCTVMEDGDWLERGKLGRRWKGMGGVAGPRGGALPQGTRKFIVARLEMGRPEVV
jgi:hypothetical protein